MTIRCLKAEASAVYSQVFRPLAKSWENIQSSQNPSVKLKTCNETEAMAVKIQCIINDTASSPIKSTRKPTWNYGPLTSATALNTATNALRSGIGEVDLEFEFQEDPTELENLQIELQQIAATLRSALKTIEVAAATYLLENCPIKDFLVPQYKALEDLLEKINKSLENINAQLKGAISTFEMDDFEEPKVHTHPRMRVKEELVFNNDAEASEWFCEKLQRCRSSNPRANFTNSEAFSAFAESLDATFKDKGDCHKSVQEIFHLLRSVLWAKELEISPPCTFKGLLTELYEKKAAREIYQALLVFLVNEEGTGPRGRGYQLRVLNAMMNSDFFFWFDSDHVVKF